MSNTGVSSSIASTLCRCGRTTILDDGKIARQRLDCGHYICSDCWHYNEPMLTPLCGTCVLGVQRQEIPRLSLFVTAFQDLLKRYNELETTHKQLKLSHSQLESTLSRQTVEYRDQIGKLRKTVVDNMTKAHPVANSLPPQLQTSLAAAPGPQFTSASTSKQTIDWNSDQGKTLTKYLVQNKEQLNASQIECATLKNRIAELTAQLETNTDVNTVTATEKAELMEAELEGLHERLDKCEEDLNVAQSELAAARTRNEELTRDNEQHKAKAASDRATLSKAHLHFTALQSEYTKVKNELVLARQSLKAKDEALRSHAESSRTSVNASTPGKSVEERAVVYVPSAGEWEKSAALLVSLQNEVARLNRDKVTLDHELAELRKALDAKEQENEVLGDKLHTSADLASELSRLHVAANTRSAAAENKLLATEKALRDAKELISVRDKENRDMQNIVDITKLAQQSELISRITSLEAELANITSARDDALAQIDGWEQNRGAWKRWGEAMALRAKQWEEEAQRARRTRNGETSLRDKVQLEEPPPLTPPSAASLHLSLVPGEESGKTRKRPHDMPDTDVDGLYGVAQSSSDETVQGRAIRMETDSDEGGSGGRKRARFVEGSEHKG